MASIDDSDICVPAMTFISLSFNTNFSHNWAAPPALQGWERHNQDWNNLHLPFSPWPLMYVLFSIRICILSIFNEQHLHATVCVVRNSKTANTQHRLSLGVERTCLFPKDLDPAAASWYWFLSCCPGFIGSDRILPHCPCARAWFGFLRAQVFPTSPDCPQKTDDPCLHNDSAVTKWPLNSFTFLWIICYCPCLFSDAFYSGSWFFQA